MRAPVVYTLLQVPGFLFLGIIVMFAWEKGWISGTTALGIMSAWVIKDALFYRFYRKALSSSTQDVIARLHGSEAKVISRLDPVGQVSVRGEIWQAVNVDKTTIDTGQSVKILGNKGLTLEVRSE